MSYKRKDINVLANIVARNILSVNKAIDWCYTQYTEKGAPEWIERIILSTDKNEFLDVLKSEFDVDGTLSDEYLVGEAAYCYKKGDLSLNKALKVLLFEKQVQLSGTEKGQLYQAEDYYYWHENPDKVALEAMSSVFDKYYSAYAESYEMFDLSIDS